MKSPCGVVILIIATPSQKKSDKCHIRQERRGRRVRRMARARSIRPSRIKPIPRQGIQSIEEEEDGGSEDGTGVEEMSSREGVSEALPLSTAVAEGVTVSEATFVSVKVGEEKRGGKIIQGLGEGVGVREGGRGEAVHVGVRVGVEVAEGGQGRRRCGGEGSSGSRRQGAADSGVHLDQAGAVINVPAGGAQALTM